MYSENDILLFRSGITNPNLIQTILKYDTIENQAIKEVLTDILLSYQETKQLCDLSVYYSKLDIVQNTGLFTPLVLNDATMAKFSETIRIKSKESFFTKLLKEDANNQTPEIEIISKLWKDNVYDYHEAVEERFRLRSPQDFYLIKKLMEEKLISAMSTGLPNLDKVLNGGWYKKNLFEFVGVVGLGKSIFLTNCAGRCWYNGNKVLYISTEMDRIDVLDRFGRSIYDAETLAEVCLKSRSSFPKGAEFEVIKVEPDAIDANYIQELIDKLEWTPEIIFIDYIDEINGTIKTKEDYDKHGVTSSDLKKLAERNDIPVVTATQANRSAVGERGGTKENLNMTMIADSFKKTRKCQAVFILVQTSDEKKEGRIGLKVAKNRFGETPFGNLKFTVNYATMRIDEDITQKVANDIAEKAYADLPMDKKGLLK